MKKTLLAFLCISLITVGFAGCGDTSSTPPSGDDSKTTTSSQQTTASTQTTVAETTVAEKASFGIGETWTVDGQWKLTVTGVTTTEKRNEFSDKSPAAVYIVDFTYENLGYEDAIGLMDGLYFNLDESIIDSNKKMGYSYPGDIKKYPKETPVGASCDGQVCIGVDNAGSFTLRVSHYDGNGNEQKAVFDIAVD